MPIRLCLAVICAAAAFALISCGGGEIDPAAPPESGPEDSDDQAPPQDDDEEDGTGEEAQPPDSSTERLVYSELGFPYVLSRFNYGIGGDGIARESAGLSVLGSSYGPNEDIGLSYGKSKDGIGRESLIAELQEDIRDNQILLRWQHPPTVSFAVGTSETLIDMTHNVVAMVNTALPPDWQLSIDFKPTDNPPEEGAIHMTFAPQSEWPDDFDYDPLSIGLSKIIYITHSTYSDEFVGEIVQSPIWIDAFTSASNASLIRTIGHELLHSLGRGHPIDLQRTDTIMSYSNKRSLHILYPLDQEALLAVYGRLEPGTAPSEIAAELGEWDDDALHFAGSIELSTFSGLPLEQDSVGFGVRSMNGRQTPWAFGRSPASTPAGNPALAGTATWSGTLIGLTPAEAAVNGQAILEADIARGDGDLEFTSLETWDEGKMPSAPGTGETWGDGDLQYSVQLFGNAFGNFEPVAGDDAGVVEGGFFGTQHEAMAGVLERNDLTAAFGGSR